jgi:hypothetical protein
MTYREPARTAARSLASWSSSAPGAPAARHVARSPRLLAAALVALICTGCSNAPADTGSGGDENAAGDQSAAAEADPGPEPKEKRFELARCMRENGVEDFPDPDDDGIIQYHGEDPEFGSAQEKCRGFSPPREEGREGNGG